MRNHRFSSTRSRTELTNSSDRLTGTPHIHGHLTQVFRVDLLREGTACADPQTSEVSEDCGSLDRERVPAPHVLAIVAIGVQADFLIDRLPISSFSTIR